MRVPPELQGRVFATRQVVERAMTPIAFLVAGPLAERVFEPLVRSGGAVGGALEQLVGTGSTRGIGLLFVVLGLAQVGLALGALGLPRLRKVDQVRARDPRR